MKALKGLLIYIGIVLGMMLGVCIILFSIMYFVPTFRIMGIGVAKNNEVIRGNPVVLSEYSTLSDIELNISSKKMGIIVTTDDSIEDIVYRLELSVFGLSFDSTRYNVVKDVELKNSTLKVNLVVSEPNGVISTNSSCLKVFLPKDKYYSIIANTESGDISISGGKTFLKLDRLTIATGSGDLSIANIDNFVESRCVTNLQSLNLATNSGKFNLSKLNDISVSSEVKLSGNNGSFEFDNLRASIDATGSGIKIKANEISTGSKGFKFISENGFFKIGKIITPLGAENTIVTENCNIDIDEIIGRTGIITTYGNINIGTLRDNAVLSSEHGNISINKALANLRVTTDMGNINVNSYEKNAIFTSRKGDIDVKSTSDYLNGVYTQIENKDGAIKVDNKINKLLVTTTGSSKVEIIFREIKGELDNPMHVFKHMVNINNYGSAIVYMPTINKVPFKFIAKGKIDGEISGLIPEYEGNKVQSSDNFQYYPSSSETSKSECQKSCYFEFLGTITFKSFLNRE